MLLEQKMAELQMRVLQTADDTTLTAHELQRKYTEKPVALPEKGAIARTSSPARCNGVTARHSCSNIPNRTFLRCFACDTLLRDPSAACFACNACGAFNEAPGFEMPSASSNIVKLSRRQGRTLAILGAAVACLLAYRSLQLFFSLANATAWLGPLSSFHYLLVAALLIGATFNYAADLLVDPGFVSAELNPLRNGQLSQPTRLLSPCNLEAADGTSRTTIASKPGQSSWQHGAGLPQLIAQRGEMPLRAWRWSQEAGLSIPPRAAYCHKCRAIVLRQEYHCMLTGSCIGLRNYHYHFCMLAYTTLLAGYLCAMSLCVLACGAQSQPTETSADATIDSLNGSLLTEPQSQPDTSLKPEARSDFSRLCMAMFLILAFAALAVAAGKQLWILLINLRKGVTHAESRQSPPPVEYNQGFRRNFQHIFGGSPSRLLIHLLPVPRSAVGDGTVFPTRRAGVASQSFV